MKFNWFLKHIYQIILFLILVAGIAILIFLYSYYYQTIVHAKFILVLRKEVALETIDTNLWQKVIKEIDKKKETKETNKSELKNPFVSLE